MLPLVFIYLTLAGKRNTPLQGKTQWKVCNGCSVWRLFWVCFSSKNGINRSSLISLLLILLLKWVRTCSSKQKPPHIVCTFNLFVNTCCLRKAAFNCFTCLRTDDVRRTGALFTNLFSLLLSKASFGTTTRWRYGSMTTWTSSAPTTPTRRYHRMWQSATSCTWWRKRTTMCANLTRSISSAGSAQGPSLPMLQKNFQRSFSASHPSHWEKSSGQERAITISVSSTRNKDIFF